MRVNKSKLFLIIMLGLVFDGKIYGTSLAKHKLGPYPGYYAMNKDLPESLTASGANSTKTIHSKAVVNYGGVENLVGCNATYPLQPCSITESWGKANSDAAYMVNGEYVEDYIKPIINFTLNTCSLTWNAVMDTGSKGRAEWITDKIDHAKGGMSSSGLCGTSTQNLLTPGTSYTTTISGVNWWLDTCYKGIHNVRGDLLLVGDYQVDRSASKNMMTGVCSVAAATSTAVTGG